MCDDIKNTQKSVGRISADLWFFTLLRTICVCFLRDVEDVVPYRKILLFSVREAFRLPFFVHGMRLCTRAPSTAIAVPLPPGGRLM